MPFSSGLMFPALLPPRVEVDILDRKSNESCSFPNVSKLIIRLSNGWIRYSLILSSCDLNTVSRGISLRSFRSLFCRKTTLRLGTQELKRMTPTANTNSALRIEISYEYVLRCKDNRRKQFQRARTA